MTNKEFLKDFNHAPLDDRELAEIARGVQGKVGVKANEFILAMIEFYEILERIGYERG